jgi:hypothetical protein
VLVAALAVSLASCARAEPEETLWQSSDRPWPPRADGSTRELGIVDLPQMPGAGFPAPFRVEYEDELTDPPTDGSHFGRPIDRLFHLNLEKSGNVYFKGHSWPLAKDATTSLDRLDREFGALARGPGRRFTVNLRLDAGRPVREVRQLLDAVRSPAREDWRVSIEVETALSRQVGLDGRLDSVLHAGGPGDARAAIAEWSVAGGDRGPHLRIGERSWTFPVAKEPYARGASLDAANVLWREVAVALREGTGPVRVVTAEDVAWAYPVMTVDRALVAGRPAVLAVSDRHVFDVTTPPAAGITGVFSQWAITFSPWHVIAIAGGLVLVVVLGTFLVNRRRRRLAARR